jgi:hypothetical protein
MLNSNQLTDFLVIIHVLPLELYIFHSNDFQTATASKIIATCHFFMLGLNTCFRFRDSACAHLISAFEINFF